MSMRLGGLGAKRLMVLPQYLYILNHMYSSGRSAEDHQCSEKQLGLERIRSILVQGRDFVQNHEHVRFFRRNNFDLLESSVAFDN